MAGRAAPLLALLLGCATPALAMAQATAPGAQQLREAQQRAATEREAAEAAARHAQALAQEEARLAQRRVAAARQLQLAEQRLAEVDDRARSANLAALYARYQASQQAAALVPLLPVMRRLALWPAESLLAVPASAADAARGLLVLQGLSRQVGTEVAALRLAERNAEGQAAAAAQQGQELAAAQGMVRRLAQQLEDEMAEARLRLSGASTAEAEAARRAQEAATRAVSLEAALAQLERPAGRQEVAARRPEPARGGRAMPVAGQVVREFGAAGEGGAARGLTLQAAPGARVVSACGGRVSFAGPFRSYGNLLIVDCGAAYHFVLAGLERLDVAAGQRVLAGEPVGVLAATEGRSRALLYLELRHHGQPVDPRPWLAARG